MNGDVEHENHRYIQLCVSRVLWFGITVITYYIVFYEEFNPFLKYVTIVFYQSPTNRGIYLWLYLSIN